MGAYYRVKADVAELVLREIARIEADPKLSQLLPKKKQGWVWAFPGKKLSLPSEFFNTWMKELIEKIQQAYDAFSAEAALQVEKGNKAAGTRARKASLEVEKLMKEFRKESLTFQQ